MEDIQKHFLYPSSIFASQEPYFVSTVLGSCVAVCLWDKIMSIGGINHYMLPYWNGQGLASPKYGNIAIEELIKKMLKLGARNQTMIAKIFGGGEVIQTNISQFNIGARNIAVAIEMLEEARIPLVASSVGGNSGRKIIYYTSTGEVKMKFVSKTQ